MKRTAIVIGGGISGLATANLLAKDGWSVDVYEQNEQLGGRAGWLEIDGFKFDTGPSWYLMPEVFDHYFALLGRRLSDYIKLERLSPAYQVFSGHQAPVQIFGDLNRDATTFESLEPGAGTSLRRYVAKADTTYHMAMKHFLYSNFSSAGSLFAPDVWRSLGALPRRPYLNQHVSKHFHQPLLQQIMQYHSVFLGLSPYRAPSLYSLMCYLDFQGGVFYPQGGMYEIIRALEKVGLELGVRHHTSTPVRSITSENGRATGIVLANGSQVAAELVVASGDLHHTETALLAPSDRTYSENYWQRAESGPSALLMYLGVKGRLPQLAHHNLLFAGDWRETFGDIFERSSWPKTASMYLCAPSRTDSQVAPDGDENLFVLVPGPALKDSGASQDLDALAATYLAQIAQTIGVPDLEDRIVVKQLFGPADFASNFGAWRGSALGLGHTWSQTAIFRPGVKSRRLKGLYYVGTNVRPGIGLPMCLISAQLVMKSLAGDRSAGPAPLPGYKSP